MRLRPAVPEAALVLSASEVWATRSMGGSLSLAVACAATAALLVRRRFPLPAFLATLPALSLGYVWLAPMAALYQVASGGTGRTAAAGAGAGSLARPLVTPRMWVVGGCATAVAVVSFVPWPWLGTVDWQPAATILALLLSALLATAPTALGLLGASRRELAARLDELAASREREGRLAAEQAVVRERARLAREMHDTVAHHISLIAVQSGALEVTARSQEARDAAGAVRELSRDALDELRRMVGLLRLPVTNAAGPGGGTGAAGSTTPAGPGLAELPALLATAGPTVRSRVDAGSCPTPVGQAAYRIVQESLTNVRKHATGAETEVDVRLAGDRLLVSVRNGPAGGPPGPPLPSGGHGLTGLRERAAQLGGTLDASAQPDGGFLVRALLPVG